MLLCRSIHASYLNASLCDVYWYLLIKYSQVLFLKPKLRIIISIVSCAMDTGDGSLGIAMAKRWIGLSYKHDAILAKEVSRP